MYQPRQAHGGFATILTLIVIFGVFAFKLIPVLVTHECKGTELPAWQAPCAQLTPSGAWEWCCLLPSFSSHPTV